MKITDIIKDTLNEDIIKHKPYLVDVLGSLITNVKSNFIINFLEHEFISYFNDDFGCATVISNKKILTDVTERVLMYFEPYIKKEICANRGLDLEFRTKPTTVKAYRVSINGNFPGWIIDDPNIHIFISKENIYMKINNGDLTQRASIGDWVVKKKSGAVSCCSNEEFVREYERI